MLQFRDIYGRNFDNFDHDLQNKPRINSNMQISLAYKTFHLMELVLFALSVAIHEIFSNEINVQTFVLE